jgi:hypothetical protein
VHRRDTGRGNKGVPYGGRLCVADWQRRVLPVIRRALNPLVVLGSAFVYCAISGVHHATRLDQQQFDFGVRTGLVFNTFGTTAI